jgi:hypothetical protein
MLRVREAEKYWMPVAKGYGVVVVVVVEVVLLLVEEERMKLLGDGTMSPSPSPPLAVEVEVEVVVPLAVVLLGNTKAQKSMTWLPCGLISFSRWPDLRAT